MDGDRRPDMVVCQTCSHFREKQAEVRHRWIRPGRPPGHWRLECMWFHTREGLAASQDDRLVVMVAGANGGRGCPVVRTS